MLSKLLVALLAGAATVSAHGYVSNFTINGKFYNGYNPTWADPVNRNTPGWSNGAKSTEYVNSNNLRNPDIICHKGAKNGQKYATVTAGDKIELQWSTWDISHHGPILDYLADCNGDCTTVDKTNLKWVKIDQSGRLGPGGETGVWATDKFRKNGLKWKVTIPAPLAPGKYILRHELIALHEAFVTGEAQHYPQCINLIVKGSGRVHPKGGVVGTKLYQRKDPGLDFNIYEDEEDTKYQIPGPKVWRPSPAGGARDADPDIAPDQATLDAVITSSASATEIPSASSAASYPKPTSSSSFARRNKRDRPSRT